MADIAVGSVERIVKVALAIKEAVETVKQNEKECRDIQRCVVRVSALLKRLDETTETMKDEVMRGTLEDLEASLERALELVMDCQRKHIFRRFLWAGDMAKELGRVRNDILWKLTQGTFATMIHATIMMTNIQNAGAAAHPSRPQDVEAVKTSHNDGHHSAGDACAEVVNSKKEETMLGTGGGKLPADSSSGIKQFSLSQLKAATNDFSNDNVLGTGGFSVVYKGLLRDGQDVAIKKLLISDDFPERNPHHELNIGAKLQHKNIVRLLGYCLDTQVEEKLFFLVQEYMPNGSLERIINASRLDWPSCYQIIQGIAQGVHYLHKHRILHMDLKPANILFDSYMNPVITDFGVSLVLDAGDDEIIWDALVGTLGYIAPEKITQANVSMKSDVFSFGIILTEIITGRKVSPSDDTLEWGSVDMIREMNGLFDPTLVDECQLIEINRCLKVGLMCSEWDPKDRPTMADVLEMLNG